MKHESPQVLFQRIEQRLEIRSLVLFCFISTVDIFRGLTLHITYLMPL